MGTHTYRRAETRAVLDAVRRVVQALRESARTAEQRVGVSGAQLFVLHTLAESPAISLNALAVETHTHQSSVSTVVTRLVARGLVQRARSATDARQLVLSLSPRGRSLVARAPDAAQQRLVLAVDRLAPARRRLLASTLSELAAAMDTVARVPAMFFEDGASRAGRVGRRG